MGKIRIYTNESVNVAIAEGLKRRGVDAFSARDTGRLGLTDEEQLLFAEKEMEEGKTHHGIIYCHQKSYSIGECIRKLRVLTSLLTSEEMVNHIEFL
ncbi:MAG: hypothetical protein JRI90_13220 [Deltaproteobacteria bacterium]|nr:hypothetical protein [Deltaproteobacteria bacterium]